LIKNHIGGNIMTVKAGNGEAELENKEERIEVLQKGVLDASNTGLMADSDTEERCGCNGICSCDRVCSCRANCVCDD